MSGVSLSDAALYTGYGEPFRNEPVPPMDGPDGLIHTRPACQVFCDLDHLPSWDGDADLTYTVDLTYILPLEPGPYQIAPHHLGALVAVLDQGGKVALHGPDDEAIAEAIGIVLMLAGGGRV